VIVKQDFSYPPSSASTIMLVPCIYFRPASPGTGGPYVQSWAWWLPAVPIVVKQSCQNHYNCMVIGQFIAWVMDNQFSYYLIYPIYLKDVEITVIIYLFVWHYDLWILLVVNLMLIRAQPFYIWSPIVFPRQSLYMGYYLSELAHYIVVR